MTRRLWLAAGGLLIASILAIAFRGFVGETLVPWLAYLWWEIGLYYDSIPQLATWILIILLSAYISIDSLIPDKPSAGKKVPIVAPVRGQIESLSIWLTKAPHGSYFKWLVAQRLGKLARDFLAFRERRAPAAAHELLGGSGWNPPTNVAAYLETGLNGSFADFPLARWPFKSPESTPLDLNPQEALEFIESNLTKP